MIFPQWLLQEGLINTTKIQLKMNTGVKEMKNIYNWSIISSQHQKNYTETILLRKNNEKWKIDKKSHNGESYKAVFKI